MPTSCHTFSNYTERSNKKKSRHLTFADRIYIEVWDWERKSLRYMEYRLGVHPSTVSRELRRDKTGWLAVGYRAACGEQRRRLWAC